MNFAGFDRSALSLLDELPQWQADRYAAAKHTLTAGILEPGFALIRTVATRLDAALTVDRRRSVSPLHTDLRFAPAGSPRYKDHLLLTTWQGETKGASPTLWIRIDATRAGFASGISFTPPIRERWRTAVAGDAGAELEGAIATLRAARPAEVAGDSLKRTPSPYPDTHPRADLLRLTGLQVRFIEPLPRAVGSAAFGDWCADRLESLMPVHRWLVQELMTAAEGE